MWTLHYSSTMLEKRRVQHCNLVDRFPRVSIPMDLSLTLRCRPSELSLLPRKSISPIKFPGRQYQPIFPRRKTNPETSLSAPKLHLIVMAKKRSPIEGVSEELNAIASQNLDMAPARRRVRLAFVEVQQQLDHCLFKVGLVPS